MNSQKQTKKNVKDEIQKKTKDVLEKIIKKKKKLQKEVDKKFPKVAKLKCPQGYIKKTSYKISERKNKKKVPVKKFAVEAECIKTRVGKDKNIKDDEIKIAIKKGLFKNYGYENINDLTKIHRHRSIKKVLKKTNPLSVYRRMLALINLNKDEKLNKILKDDKDWIKSQKEYLER